VIIAFYYILGAAWICHMFSKFSIITTLSVRDDNKLILITISYIVLDLYEHAWQLAPRQQSTIITLSTKVVGMKRVEQLY